MFLGSLSTPSQSQTFLQSPALKRSLQWVVENARSAAEGIYELGEPGWFVNVHGYTTQARDLCTWENHPQTIDLQYWIEGIEGIDLTAVESLGEPTVFNQDSDTQKFAANDEPATQLVLRPDNFIIFLPGEAHRPKIAVQSPAVVKKLVVKIPARLLGGE